jgi:hypothetical protein
VTEEPEEDSNEGPIEDGAEAVMEAEAGVEAGGKDVEAGGKAAEAGGKDAEAGGKDAEAGGKDAEAGGMDAEAGGKDAEAGGMDAEAAPVVAATKRYRRCATFHRNAGERVKVKRVMTSCCQCWKAFCLPHLQLYCDGCNIVGAALERYQLENQQLPQQLENQQLPQQLENQQLRQQLENQQLRQQLENQQLRQQLENQQLQAATSLVCSLYLLT